MFAIVFELNARSIPNTYKFKDTRMKEIGASLETLILGNSLSFHGINPRYFNNAFNLANEGQRLEIDLFLLQKYQPICHNLRNVIINISEENLFQAEYESQKEPTWPVLIYYGIYMSYPKHGMFSEFNYELTIPKHAFLKIKEWYMSKISHTPFDLKCDSLGWNDSRENMRKRDTRKMNEKFFKIKTTTGRKFDYLRYENNKNYLDKIIQYCKSHQLMLIVIRTPLYQGFINSQIKEKTFLINSLGDDLKKNKSVLYKDYSNDSRLSSNIDLFFDGIHLAPQGASIFSKLLKEDFNL